MEGGPHKGELSSLGIMIDPSAQNKINVQWDLVCNVNNVNVNNSSTQKSNIAYIF